MTARKIAVVCHCFAVNEWKTRLEYFLQETSSSGLYEAANELYLMVTDLNNQRHLVEEVLVTYPKWKLEYQTKNDFESPAIAKIDRLGKNTEEKYYLFYFHVKGVFNKYKNFKTKEYDSLKIQGIRCWTEMLTYFLLRNWKNCVSKLEEGFDTVGVTNVHRWWWGNFWWATSEHIQKNVAFSPRDRWFCEAWIHEANSDIQNIKFYEFFHFSHDGYYTVIPQYLYDGSQPHVEFTIHKAEYGYFAEQRDEGQQLPFTEPNIIDITDVIKKYIGQETSNIKIECNHYMLQIEKPKPDIANSLRIFFSTNIDPENEYVVTVTDGHFINIRGIV